MQELLDFLYLPSYTPSDARVLVVFGFSVGMIFITVLDAMFDKRSK